MSRPTCSGCKAVITWIRKDEAFELRVGAVGQVICWGVMPSGLLRHPVSLDWRA